MGTTSRCERTRGRCGLPISAAARMLLLTPAWNMVPSMSSAWALCGNACIQMSPRFTAAETRCVSVAFGQMTPVGSKGGPTVGKSAGQSRKTSITQESAMYRIAGGWPAARSADAVAAAEARNDG